jgi:NitT/TauT family transport system substrate-binding protein
MLMADHGLVLYGNAIMVNPDFAKANPKVVAGFVRATIKGIIDTYKDPEAAIKSVMKRNETADEKIELARLKMSLRDNFVTDLGEGKRRRRDRREAHAASNRADRRLLRVQEREAEARRHLRFAQFLPPASERKL